LEIKEPLDKKGEKGYNLQSPNVLGEEWKIKVRISIGELKRDLSGVINQAAYGKERIVIVSRGKPKAAMIGMEDLERLQRINSYDREAQIAWLARTRQWQAAHGIEPQDSAEILRQLREERVDEILGVR